MPFAGFEDWDACVRTMTEEESHDQSAAERICGALQEEAKAENGNVDELRQALERGRGLIADVGVDLNSAVDRPAINSKWTMFKSTDADGHDTQIDAPIVLKQDGGDKADQRIAFAPAMIPREVDKEGDVVGTATVERAAHDYLKQDGGVDADHDLIDGKGEPVESWTLDEAKEYDLPDGGTETYPAGTWMVGIEWDAETWDRIQSGELEGLSIYGKADHVPLEKAAETAKAFEVPFADETVVHVVYESETAARKASEELGLGGEVHGHTFDGMDVFMPGADHEAFVDAYMDLAESGDEVVSMALQDGATPKSDGTATSEQDSSMSDTDIEDRVDKMEDTVSSVEETVESIKDAVETDKQPGDGDAGGTLRNLAEELANREEVAASTSEIMTELKSSFLSDKADDGDMGDGMDDEEDDEVDVTVENESDEYDDEEKAAKSTDADGDDAEPHFKGTDGSDSAAVAKENSGGSSGLPSYTEAIEEGT